MSVPQYQQDEDLELNWAPEARAPIGSGNGDDVDRSRTDFSSWSLELACANTQRW
jgi:hypothetical protein